jgi:hypothetical protein
LPGSAQGEGSKRLFLEKEAKTFTY